LKNSKLKIPTLKYFFITSLTLPYQTLLSPVHLRDT